LFPHKQFYIKYVSHTMGRSTFWAIVFTKEY
jgi:hypothetical protein